jgi:hypothetical protein
MEATLNAQRRIFFALEWEESECVGNEEREDMGRGKRGELVRVFIFALSGV